MKLLWKKVMVIMLACVSLFTVAIFSTACDKETESYYNLEATGTVYFEGEQTITLTISEHTQHQTTFNQSIETKDVSVSGLLNGKSVESVVWINDEEVQVMLSGKVVAQLAQPDEYGTITVSHTAMANGANANSYVSVNFSPKMTRTHNSYDTLNKKYISEFILPYGSFIKWKLKIRACDAQSIHRLGEKNKRWMYRPPFIFVGTLKSLFIFNNVFFQLLQ